MEKDSKRRSDKISARKVVRIRPGMKSIVLGVTGSIAAYKSAELASLLIKQGHQVFVVMTQDATEFITPLTLQTLSKNPVTTSFYDEKENWRPGHIELADRGYEGLGRLWKVDDIAFRAEFLLARQENLIA